jgi:hypothetical protein
MKDVSNEALADEENAWPYDRDEPENDILHIAATTLLGDLMAFVTDEVKAMPDVWQKLPERDQRFYLDRCETRLEKAVERCVNIISCGDFIHVQAQLHKMTIEKGVDITLKGQLSEDLHALQDHMKEYVRIVLPQPAQFTEDRSTEPQADPDQADMIGAGAEYENQ